MRRLLLILILALGLLFCGTAYAQRVTNGSYQTVQKN